MTEVRATTRDGDLSPVVSTTDNGAPAPSDHADLAEWLLEEGIDSMSLNPDTVVETWTRLGQLVAKA